MVGGRLIDFAPPPGPIINGGTVRGQRGIQCQRATRPAPGTCPGRAVALLPLLATNSREVDFVPKTGSLSDFFQNKPFTHLPEEIRSKPEVPCNPLRVTNVHRRLPSDHAREVRMVDSSQLTG
jgi:hypothetical protein